MLSVIADDQARAELHADLDELAREGARRMLAAALEAEVDDYLTAHAGERDEAGRRLVVRNGHARAREVTTVAGSIPVRAPRVDDRRIDPVNGERMRFRSVILPPWCRGDSNVAAKRGRRTMSSAVIGVGVSPPPRGSSPRLRRAGELRAAHATG